MRVCQLRPLDRTAGVSAAVGVFVYERVSSIRVMMLCFGVQELLCRQNFRMLR
jgi:hypothetical protein